MPPHRKYRVEASKLRRGPGCPWLRETATGSQNRQKATKRTKDGGTMVVRAGGLGCFVSFVPFCGLAELRKTEPERLHQPKTREWRDS